MQQITDDLEVRADLIAAMRELAEQGKGVRELVRCVQSELDLDPDALLSVLWYFMKAFHLSLGNVLPIREWLGTDHDEVINAIILPAIHRAKETWSGAE